MALHPVTQEIAATFGYTPMSAEEGSQQYQVTPNWDQDKAKLPVNGSVYINKKGTYRFYWVPQGGNYTPKESKDLQGWYDIPFNEDLEEWSFDSVCFTPADDEVEPDHPDSWLSLLGLI